MDNSTDINKMSVHLEQILAERDKVDLKIRQTLTEPNIRSSDFIIFCGYDSSVLSEFFKALSVVESIEGEGNGPTLFLYEEPGQSIWGHLNYLLMQGMDLKRIKSKIFNKIVDSWSYRDIISSVDVRIRQIGIESTTSNSSSSDGGDVPEAAGI